MEATKTKPVLLISDINSMSVKVVKVDEDLIVVIYYKGERVLAMTPECANEIREAL
jgi:nitrite reductase/ring-hydroxylating ferredoxin subunit